MNPKADPPKALLPNPPPDGDVAPPPPKALEPKALPLDGELKPPDDAAAPNPPPDDPPLNGPDVCDWDVDPKKDPNADGLEFPKRFDPPPDGALELDDSPNGLIFAFSGFFHLG